MREIFGMGLDQLWLKNDASFFSTHSFKWLSDVIFSYYMYICCTNKFVQGTFSINSVRQIISHFQVKYSTANKSYVNHHAKYLDVKLTGKGGNNHFSSDGFHFSVDKSRLFSFLPQGYWVKLIKTQQVDW